MALEKSDFKQIEKIVKTAVQSSEKKLDKKIDDTKNEIITVLSREVKDLAEINRTFISRIDNHEVRIVKIENKIGLSKV